MNSAKHVLFVCTGNTCRSPMAEALLRKALENRDDFSVSSAGVAAYPGSTASPETLKIVKTKGASLESFKSRPVTNAILNEASHVFVMTESHLAALEAKFPSHSHKYYLLGEFATPPHPKYGNDVPDPIGCGLRAYEEVATVFESAIPSIIAFIDSLQE